LHPSLDRRDFTKPYSFENTQWMTWQENHRKGTRERYGTEGGMCDMEGEELQRVSSFLETAKAINVSSGNISAVCRGKRPYTKGYTWKYGKSFHYRDTKYYEGVFTGA